MELQYPSNFFSFSYMTTTPSTRGVWGAIARYKDLSALAQDLVTELESGLSLLQRLPAAITFFGGARIRPSDPYYRAAERMGELLATAGIPPRTGAGPGIMTAVPSGFHQQLHKDGVWDGHSNGSESASHEHHERPQALTQGFNIKLPFEQSINPAIDVSLELAHFPTRKLMLYANTLGIVIFPGGFGTMHQLFELLTHIETKKMNPLPIILFGREFWQPLLEFIHTLHANFNTISHLDEGIIKVIDEPSELLPYLDLK